MNWLTLILMAAGTLATAWVLASAVRRWWKQKRSGTNGTKLFIARHEVTHQLLRMVKHSLIFYCVGMWLFDFPETRVGWVETRNIIVAVVGAIMGLASVLEYRFWCRLRDKIRVDLSDQHDDDTGAERRIDRPAYQPPMDLRLPPRP